MGKKFQKIQCGECSATIAFKIEENIEIKCEKCGKKNIIPKVIQFEEIKQKEVTAKIT